MCKSILKVLLIVCVSAIVNSDEYPPKELLEMLKPIHSYCRDEVGTTEEALQTYDINNKDHKLMCYMACFMHQSNWMSINGEIKYDFILNNPWEPIKDIMINAVSKCTNIEQIDDECEYIYNFAKCIHDADVEHWFMP